MQKAYKELDGETKLKPYFEYFEGSMDYLIIRIALIFM